MTPGDDRTSAGAGDDARARRPRLALVLAVVAAVLVVAGVIAAIALSPGGTEQVTPVPTTGEPGTTTPDVTPSPDPEPTTTPDEPAPTPAPSPSADPTPAPSLSAPPAQDVPYPTDPDDGK